ncbi:MAG: hypothetical protein RL685_7628, partial [Pseudomonadota bacterium]
MRGLAWQLPGTVFGCVELGVALLSGAGLGCTVLQDEASDARETRAVCISDSECSTGHCQLAFGVCS